MWYRDANRHPVKADAPDGAPAAPAVQAARRAAVEIR